MPRKSLYASSHDEHTVRTTAPRAQSDAGPPFADLQATIGNQALQRLLVQRREVVEIEELEGKEREDWLAQNEIRSLLKNCDLTIDAWLEIMEKKLTSTPDERENKLPKVQAVRQIHQTNGIMTLTMLDMLMNAILPVKFEETIETAREVITDYIEEKERIHPGLHDPNPKEWLDKYKTDMHKRIEANPDKGKWKPEKNPLK